VRFKRQRLGHGAGRHLDLRPARPLIGKIAIPELVANIHWGGENWRTLFICATHSLYSVETKVGPRNEPFMRARGHSTSRPAEAPTAAATAAGSDLVLDPARCALIIQDMQNDVVMDGGAFAESGAPQHCREQNCIENIRRLAEHCRRRGVRHPRVVRRRAACPSSTHIVRKMRMSAWEGTSLETILKAEGRDVLIETGAWTNMSIEHTARTGADKGYVMIIPEDGCSTMNADWHNASINYALQNVAAVTKTHEVISALV
jgi:gluconolactonase